MLLFFSLFSEHISLNLYKNTLTFCFFQDNCGVEYSDEGISNVSMNMEEVGFDDQLLFIAVVYNLIAKAERERFY